MNKVCLIIIFNHRYDANIPKLRKIYGKRFRNIKYLIPFYDGSDEDVIPVYENSYQFHGYLIQAYEKLKQTGSDYFLFIGDDLILNPAINETNVVQETGMADKEIGVVSFACFNKKNMFLWMHAKASSTPFLHRSVS